VVSLGAPKPFVKAFLNAIVYSPLNMDATRRARLAKLLATRYKGDRAQLINDSGLSKGRISQLLEGSEPFGERAARGLEQRLNLPERWLDQYDPSNVEPAPEVRGGVPLISWIQAGDWAEASDPFHPGEAEAWIPSVKPHSERAFALRVRGDSMTSPHGKSYPEGSIIIVEPERRSPVNGERIVAKLEGSSEVTFKVYKEEDGRRWLQPLNPSHEPIRQPFKVLGTVIGKWEDD
jgi:SOS-response transcriptional repressor LexA